MSAAHVGNEHRRRLLWARQQLGAVGRSGRRLADVVAALSMLHSTDPVTPYLSIHARSDVAVGDVDAAFYDERTLLRHTTIRRTVFAMPLDVVPIAHNAFNTALLRTLRTNLAKWIEAGSEVSGSAADHLERVESAVVDRVRSEGPMTGGALADAIPDLRLMIDPAPGAAYSKPIRITSKVIEIVAAEGHIARGRPTGRDYTSAAWTWAPIEGWLGGSRIEPLDPELALQELVGRHLAAFGPATLTDVTWWTGIGKLRVRSAFEALGAVEVSLDDVGEVGYVLPDDDLDAPPADDSVALLPGLDSTTMGWKQRSWYVDDRPAAGLFDRNGNAGPTIWVGGRVAGVWTQRPDGTIVTELMEDPGSDARAAVAAECHRLVEWLGDVRVNLRYPTPITKRLMAS